MTDKPSAPSFGEAAQAMGDLFNQSAKLGMAMLGPLVSGSVQMWSSVLQELKPTHGAGCCCEIPDPCWQPRKLGEVRCVVCAGGTATVRLRVENCTWTKRQVQIVIMNPSAAVTVTPAGLDLGPMERGVVAVSLAVAPSAGEGQEFEVLILVRGCNNHFLRWIVTSTTKGVNTCCSEVEVKDCVDQIHHWYDHFYCHRNCTNRSQTPDRG